MIVASSKVSSSRVHYNVAHLTSFFFHLFCLLVVLGGAKKVAAHFSFSCHTAKSCMCAFPFPFIRATFLIYFASGETIGKQQQQQEQRQKQQQRQSSCPGREPMKKVHKARASRAHSNFLSTHTHTLTCGLCVCVSVYMASRHFVSVCVHSIEPQ